MLHIIERSLWKVPRISVGSYLEYPLAQANRCNACGRPRYRRDRCNTSFQSVLAAMDAASAALLCSVGSFQLDVTPQNQNEHKGADKGLRVKPGLSCAWLVFLCWCCGSFERNAPPASVHNSNLSNSKTATTHGAGGGDNSR